DERVDDQRLEQREAEDHRAADLTGSARVARDALERAGRRTALADAAAERREPDAEARAERDPAVVGGEAVDALRLLGIHLALRVRDSRDADDDQDGDERGQDLDGSLHG